MCSFSSYLQNRSQIVNAENTVSENQNIISGLPQGSILGPMLFHIYVNDVSMHLTCNTELYADDTTLHESANCISTIQQNLQTNLLKVQTWCNTNNMIINPIKTTCMVIGSSRKLKQNCNIALSISGNKICNVQTQKLLGLYMDNTLSWKPHRFSMC